MGRGAMGLAAAASEINRCFGKGQGYRIWPMTERTKSSDLPERLRLRRIERPGWGTDTMVKVMLCLCFR